jgi:hypothetical protein
MKFYEISPEVPGEIGDNSIVDRSMHPPTVHKLEYLFHGWMGGCIVTSFPVFLVISATAKDLVGERLLGFKLAAVSITLSEEYLELYPHEALPDFKWLQLKGTAGVDDFFLSEQDLVVSERALTVLNRHGLGRDTDVREWK